VSWKIGQAKQRLSEVIRLAAKEPQVIQNRDRVVAVVISPEDAAGLRRKPTLSDALAEIQAIASHTRYVLQIPPRSTRSTGVDWIDDAPRRHKRRQ
jgi:hypothetical protein